MRVCSKKHVRVCGGERVCTWHVHEYVKRYVHTHVHAKKSMCACGKEYLCVVKGMCACGKE